MSKVRAYADLVVAAQCAEAVTVYLESAEMVDADDDTLELLSQVTGEAGELMDKLNDLCLRMAPGGENG